MVRFSTFNRIYQNEWKGALGFRQKTMCLVLYFDTASNFMDLQISQVCSGAFVRFTTCDVCEQLKSQLHNKATPIAQKLGCVKAYRSHLRDQYTDRSILWQLCDLSYSRESDIVVCWLDGMEQAKFQIPRSKGLRTASATLLSRTFVNTVELLAISVSVYFKSS